MRFRKQSNRSNGKGHPAGIASVEFVLSLPILFVLMAMIYTMGRRSLDQAGVAMAVRDRAWQQRSAVESSPLASSPFHFDQPLSGSATARKRRRLRLFPWLGGRRLSEDRTVVIAGSWDDEQVPQLRGGRPHVAALDPLTSGGGRALEAMARLLDF